ncbi:hypothetical protein JRO89_XS04G0276100 [Xanthoceras sorbifolium]|uniref:non-specific serine/threonine protein kinase n=1 Tax=Xanthoceras sorbifolium TaxID=99658 RepID=A0ABQ8I7H0_9ROSI|nr:hypothetical protein JRO89_XS04G0276100 [Xanthoceras sorbifolium]
MSSTSPPPGTTPSAPSPTSPPSSNTTSPPPPTPSAPPPATPASPPPTTPATPPPTTPASPPPSTPTSPPPPTTPTATPPTPATPSGTPPPSTPSTSPPPPSNPGTRSPPPPSSSGTPSTPTARSPPPPPTSSGGSNGVSTGLVVGIAIGGLAVLAIVTLVFICCCKKKKKRNEDEGYYMPPPPPGPKEGPYGGRQQQWQHNAPPPSDHVFAAPPKPSPPPAVASRPPYSPGISPTPPPPPPPPFMNSSGGSGSNYSGSENPLPPPSPGLSLGFSKSTFSYEELARATDGFSDANLLGQGGFGYVHKGVLPNGKEVAVKQLKAGSGQGEREFQAEVEIISRVHHKHLVSLVGYCITGSQRMLVYEFVTNNTLEFHLHGSEYKQIAGKGRPTMDWSTRLKIALGSAKGLAYLHEDCHPKIIHRDIKAANILLDFKFEAKVADFGLAKIASDLNTHVSTRVMGTFGYLAPEYASSGKLSDKSDVFSFGVMLLELITGRRPVDSTHTFMEDSLVDWHFFSSLRYGVGFESGMTHELYMYWDKQARPQLNRALEDGNFDGLVDPRLQNNYNHSEMARMVACAAACVRHSARRRPRMSQIVRALEGDVSLADLNEGIRPGQSNVYSSYGSSDYDNMQYNEDLKKFRKMALASQEYGASSEYSGRTSEYGLYPSGSSSEGQNTREMEMGKWKKNSQGLSGAS